MVEERLRKPRANAVLEYVQLCYVTVKVWLGLKKLQICPSSTAVALLNMSVLLPLFLAETDVCSYGCPNYALMCLFVLTIA